MKVDLLIEVTMKMNLAEAKIIHEALGRQSSVSLPGSGPLYQQIDAALSKAGAR